MTRGLSLCLLVQVALLGQGKPSGRLVVLVPALTTPTLVAAAAASSQPAGSFVPGTDVPAVIQVLVNNKPAHILHDVIQFLHIELCISLFFMLEQYLSCCKAMAHIICCTSPAQSLLVRGLLSMAN